MGEPGFGRYELVERLVVRPASELFVVTVSGEHGFRRQILLKRLRDDTQSASFIEDAKLSAKLSHAKIVQTLELGSIENVPYVAMDYVDGVDLLGLLNELARTRRKMEPALAAWIAQELLDALDYAHTFSDDGMTIQIVHGHLSPSKVLLGQGGEVKLCDFGVARRFDVAHAGQDFGHVSPEQVMELPVDPRSDVFGVGVLLAEMLMSRRLFAAYNEFDVLLMVRDGRISRLDLAGIDPELAAIVRKAIEKRPEDRWPNAAAFRDALDAWLFAKRAHHMNQQLAALVADARDAVDAWRRAGTFATPELDDLPDPSVPVMTAVARGSISPQNVPRVVAIPPKSAEPERIAARGTAQPETRKEDSGPVLAIPRAIDETPSGRLAHPRLVQRGASQKMLAPGLHDVLPERAPAAAREPVHELLTKEQLAKAGQPPPPQLARLDRSPDDSGDFERTSPLRVLFHLMRTRATGLLAVTLDGIRKDIYVRDGQLAGVWSNDADDLFGNYLVAQKIISDGELAMALATMSYYGGKIGDTLVGLNLLDRMEVFRQLTRHARTKVIDICTWTTGHYAYYAGNEDPREAFPLEADAFSMLGEAALALRPDVIDAWLAKHRTSRLVTVKLHRISPDVFALPRAAEVLSWVDGVRTLGAVIESHADRARAARMLYLFLACDLVRLG